MAQPLFSVIIPAYRAPRTIRSTIESVLTQTLEDLEVVVVDDGSGDETPEVVTGYAEADPRVRLVRQENAGTAAARNTGILASRGRYVSFLDNDDVWLPPYLEAVQAGFQGHPEAGLAYSDTWAFDDASKYVHRLTTLEDNPPVAAVAPGPEFLRALITINFITASSVTLTREAIDRVGPFEIDLSGSDDWDMWLRVAAAGFAGIRVGERPLVLLREHAASQSKDDMLMRQSAYRSIERAVERAAPGSPELRQATAVRARHQRSLQRLQDPTAAQRLVARVRAVLRRIKGVLVWRWRWRPPSDEVLAAYPGLRDL